MDPDKLNSTNILQLAKASFRIIDTVQHEPEAVQVQALMSLFLLMCDVHQVDVRQTLEQVDRMMKDANKQDWRIEFKAIADYIRGELRKKHG